RRLSLGVGEQSAMGLVGDDALGWVFDAADLVQLQRVEPHRVFGVVVVSRRASAGSTRGTASTVAPANPIEDNTRPRLSVMGIVISFRLSSLQLSLDLVEKTPVGPVGYDLLLV